ncbi:MAG: polyphosphate kinase 2 family protein [Bacteroides sp.]|jgi:PPK2 family polyphosphate:nucleotide phosphotransferase|nr:polyphosphate kinase 2 family protein [Bacteroides sp.]
MEQYRISPKTKVNLNEFATRYEGELEKKAGKDLLKEHNKTLRDLQELLYAEHKQKILIVLQGIDTAGKDSTIEHVFGDVNPQGTKVANFKVPTPRELAHDYLWRVHQHTPGSGEIVIFNRSHYEDVLVVRVHSLVPKSVWEKRYAHINAFEKLLADEGTTILKFFLFVSKKEQAERFLARLDRPHKRWKFNPDDLDERKRWDEYIAAYEDMLSKTSTDYAPWYVIPSDRKWHRNLTVASIIIDKLQSLNMQVPDEVPNIDQYRGKLTAMINGEEE